MFGSLRGQILTVQDRVIRMEMRLRLAQVLPAASIRPSPRSRTSSWWPCALPATASFNHWFSKCSRASSRHRRTIKSRVKDWQADHLRA